MSICASDGHQPEGIFQRELRRHFNRASKAGIKRPVVVGLDLRFAGEDYPFRTQLLAITDAGQVERVSQGYLPIAGFPDLFKLGIPLGKIGHPQEVADVILFLASRHASHITMQDIVIDGGATLVA